MNQFGKWSPIAKQKEMLQPKNNENSRILQSFLII